MERILFILGILEDEDVDWLVSAGNRQELTSGEVLIREGESINAIYLILSGQFVVSIERSRDTHIARLSSGEVVGEMSFVDHLPPSATVTAIEPAVVLMIEKTMLEKKAGTGCWIRPTLVSSFSDLALDPPARHRQASRSRILGTYGAQ